MSKQFNYRKIKLYEKLDYPEYKSGRAIKKRSSCIVFMSLMIHIAYISKFRDLKVF